MYRKLFFSMTAILIASTIAAVSSGSAALAQNQTSLGNNTAITNTAASGMTLQAAKDLYLSVWNQTEFRADFSTFVEPFSAGGYGVYKERSDAFRPGETMVLYVEPVGFGHKKVTDEQGNPLYLMNMTADYIISDAGGTELQTITDVPVGSIASHRPNTELFLELTLTQERPFPVGDYTITYVVTDEVSGKSFKLTKDITVAETVV